MYYLDINTLFEKFQTVEKRRERFIQKNHVFSQDLIRNKKIIFTNRTLTFLEPDLFCQFTTNCNNPYAPTKRTYKVFFLFLFFRRHLSFQLDTEILVHNFISLLKNISCQSTVLKIRRTTRNNVSHSKKK